jgi:2-polyprenyl-3-methyl-5-hydroxy-6-metoxy-1,4-benzoquinol methylase
MTKLSRKNPSERYEELVEKYKEIHAKGLGYFNGKSLLKYVPQVHQKLIAHECKTLLDYGAGKGLLYTDQCANVQPLLSGGKVMTRPLQELWNLTSHRCYDPAYEEHSTKPRGKFDAVISIDVLEHINEDDLEWVLNEIFSYSKKMVFLNVACFKAAKHFKDGENVHISVFNPEWWYVLVSDIMKSYPDITTYLLCEKVGHLSDYVIRGGE